MTNFEKDCAALAEALKPALELRYGDKDPIAAEVIAMAALQFARDTLGWKDPDEVREEVANAMDEG